MSNLIKQGIDYISNFPRVYKSLKIHNAIPPKQVTLELTKRCNARCIFCNRWQVSPEEIKKELTTEEWIKVIRELAKIKTQKVNLTGGEPLLRKDFFEIVEELKKHKLEITLNDNGFLLPKYAKKISEFKIDYVRVSIDSHIPEKHNKVRGVRGIWENAVKGIKLLKKYDINVAINFVLMKDNIEELEEYIRFAKGLGVDYDIQPVHDEPKTNTLFVRDKKILFSKKDLEKLKHAVKKIIKNKVYNWIDRIYYKVCPLFLTHPQMFTNIKCPVAARVIYFIDPIGNVYPCETRRDIVLGNVRTDSFKKIIRSRKAKLIRKFLYSNQRNCVCWYRCTAPSMIQYQFPPHIPLPKLGNPVLSYKWNTLIKELFKELSLE